MMSEDGHYSPWRRIVCIRCSGSDSRDIYTVIDKFGSGLNRGLNRSQ